MKFVIFIIGLMFLISCYNEVPFDKENIETKMVLFGALQNDSIIKIVLTKSQFISDTNNYYIYDANVKLYINDVYAEQMQHDSAGIYVSNIKAHTGSKYKIIAEEVGLKTIEAETYIPEKPQIDTCILIFDYGVSSIGNNTSKLDIFITDIKNVDNFYYLKVFADTNINVFQETSDPILLSEKKFIYELVFSDTYFKNIQHDFTMLISQSYKDTTSYTVVLQAVDKNYYNFKNSYFDYYVSESENYFDLNAEPSELFSNVTNGYGILYGFNETLYNFTFIKHKK